MIVHNNITNAATEYAKIQWNLRTFKSKKFIIKLKVIVKLRNIIKGSVFFEILMR